jgi:hypothetical protein
MTKRNDRAEVAGRVQRVPDRETTPNPAARGADARMAGMGSASAISDSLLAQVSEGR